MNLAMRTPTTNTSKCAWLGGGGLILGKFLPPAILLDSAAAWKADTHGIHRPNTRARWDTKWAGKAFKSCADVFAQPVAPSEPSRGSVRPAETPWGGDRNTRFIWKFALLVGMLTAISAPGFTAEKESKLFRALGWATFGAKGGDLISTEYALTQGVREVNPLMESRGARVAATIAAPLLTNLLTAQLHKDGHERLAVWTRIALVAGYSYVVAHNLRQAYR